MPTLKIQAVENGPFVVEGNASYRDPEGREQKTPGAAVALCRCGLSSKRPFCDGSHEEVGFLSEEVLLLIDVPWL